MAYWRRGALCQSLKRPLGERVKVILLAACSIDRQCVHRPPGREPPGQEIGYRLQRVRERRSWNRGAERPHSAAVEYPAK